MLVESSKVLLAVNAEVAAPAATTAAPASRTRDIRMAGSCHLEGSGPRRDGSSGSAAAAPVARHRLYGRRGPTLTPVPKEPRVTRGLAERTTADPMTCGGLLYGEARS